MARRGFLLAARIVTIGVALSLAIFVLLYGSLKTGLLGGPTLDSLVTLLARKHGVFFVRAEGITGDLPEHLRVKKVEVGDATGVWLTVEDGEAWWHPFDLFHPFDWVKWRIHVDDVHAAHVTWTRLPHDEKPDDEPFRWDHFVRIIAKHLVVDDLDVSGTLLDGARAHMKAEGHGVLGEWDHGYVLLDGERIDGTAGRVHIDLQTHGSPVELTGTVTAVEDEHSALAALARIPEAGAVKLEAHASGPMRQWHGEADVTASNIGRLHAATDLSFNASGPFEGTGTFDPSASVREQYLLGEGGPVTITARGAWAPDVEVRIDSAKFVADGRGLSADGRLDLATKEFHLSGLLSHAEPDTLVDLLPIRVATARLESKGVLGDGGHLEATLDATTPWLGSVRGKSLRAKLTAKDATGDSVPTFDLDATADGLALEGWQVRAGDCPDKGAQKAGCPGVPLVGETAHLVASGRIDVTRGMVDASHLTLDGEAVRLEGPLALREHWGAIKTSLDVDATDLRSIAPLFHAAVSGTAKASVDVTAAQAWKELDVRGKGSTADVVIAEPGWNALLAGAGTFEVNLSGAPRGPAHGDFALRTTGIDASGKAGVEAGGSSLTAEAHGVLDNLSRLSEPARAAISGRLEASAAARGTLDHFDLDLDLKGERFAWEGLHFDRLNAVVAAKDMPDKWNANVSVQAKHATIDASLDGRVAALGGNHYQLRGVALRGPKTQGNADLDVDLDTRTAAGTLRLSSQDLSLWRPMTGTALGGAVTVDATLGAGTRGSAGPSQQVSGTASVRNGAVQLDGEDWFADVLDVRADGIEIGPSPKGTAHLQATRVHSGTKTLVEAAVTATGDGRAWNFETKLSGSDGSPVTVDAAGRVTPSPSVEVTLSRLSGLVGKTSIELEKEARFGFDRRAASSWSAGPLSLKIGSDGYLRGEASQAGRALHVIADADSAPLALVGFFAPTLDLQGKLDGNVKLDGPSFSALAGEIALRGHKVASAGLETEGVEPVDINANAKLAAGRIVGSATLVGLAHTNMVLSIDSPLAATSGREPFQAALSWKGDVDEVVGLLPIGEDTIKGTIDADLHMTGTVASPRITGHALLDGGTWENSTSGLVLKDLHAELTGSGTTLRLDHVTATDGEKGTLAGNGELRFGELPAFDLQIGVEATNAMLTRLDLLTTRGDAKLTMEARRGSEDNDQVNGSVSGTIRVADARVEIPQRFVADVPEIDVVDVTASMKEAATGGSALRKLALGLDVAITADNRIFVSGRGLESEWSADLHLQGDTSDPRFSGKVTSVRGQLSLLGRRFDVDSATVLFDGSKGNEPYLTMTAKAEANDITAIADVTGPATRPNIELRSEPPLPRDEVLSRVLFGQSAATLTPLQSVALARGVAELTGAPILGGGGPGIIGGIGRTLGFDRLDIESSGSSGAAALTASKYLTDNVYLRVQQGLTPEASKLSIEWRVYKHITLESDVSQDAQGEVGATWKWDY